MGEMRKQEKRGRKKRKEYNIKNAKEKGQR